MKIRAVNLVQVIGIAVVYFLAARLGLSLTGGHVSASPVWPPTGIAIAALLLWGYKIWPGVAVGAFLATFAAPTMHGAVPLLARIAGASSTALGATLEAVVGAWLTQRYAGGSKVFEHPQSILRFIALTAVLSTTLSPAVGLLGVTAAGMEPWSEFGFNWITRWLGDLVSAIVVTPAILTWNSRVLFHPQPRRVAEFAAVLLSLVALCELICNGWLLPGGVRGPRSFVVIPVLLWAALRFGQQGTSVALLLLSSLAIFHTIRGTGSFVLPNPILSLLLLQLFVGVIAVTSLLLAASAAQRQHAESELRDSEQRYRELFESNPQPAWVYDRQTFRLFAVNQAALRQYGYTHDEFLKLSLTDLQEPAIGPGKPRPAPDTASLLAPNHLERHRTKAGTLLEVEIRRQDLRLGGRAAVMVLAQDVTEHNQAARRAAAFSDLGKRLSAARTPKDVAQIIAQTADELFGWDSCAFDLYSRERNALQNVLVIDTINGRRQEISSDSAQPGPLARATVEAGPQLILRSPGSPFPPDAQPFGDTTRPSASLMYVPIIRGAKTIGVLSIQSYTPQAYTKDDLRAFQALAEYCGGTLERLHAEEEILRLNAELEHRVVQRTRQLEAANKELEAFAYSVSHDLRAPLRSVRGFCEVLTERYSSQLDARGQDFLHRAANSCLQMDRLIEDLLKLSRLGRSELQPRPVNLSALAESIAAELQKGEPQRIVQWVIAPGLQTRADERLLRVALDNLLGNAWKFTRDQPSPRIEFGITAAPESAFFVRDNGAGFDIAYAGRLFAPFQRLHSSAEFPGTGIGLATVQRIVHRHGGRLWAQGAVDQGATFYFTFPVDGRA